MKQNKSGFTFIEVTIYIALATIILGILFAYGWNIIGARVKAGTMRETASGARLVSERLKRELRMATSISKVDSVFDEVPGKIVFETPDGTIEIQSSEDKISLKRGNSDSEFLHSDFVRIRNFTLTKQENNQEKIQYVGFLFTVEAYYPEAGNRFEYQYSLDERGGVEMRSQ
jgi:hypothetical protein